ncbi:MAG: hypothetical protein JOZ72_12225 [Alphaproteobacteria bacterium]|nr:hypothetical protein [Alphaproteobacteria bacterium]
MLSLRAHVWICAGLFAALLVVPIVGNVLAASGMAPPPRSMQLPFMIGYLVLFVAAGLSAVPVMVMTVLRAQERQGRAAALVRRQTTIIWAMWALILLGIAVAVPAMIADGFFATVDGAAARM